MEMILVLGIALPIILLIILLNKINAVTARVRWLEKELLEMRSGATSQSIPQKPAVAPVSPPIAGQKPEQPVSPIPPVSLQKEDRSRAREEWEAFVGGKLLNRIGALALTIGVAFFLKYAFDNNWISETVRVLLGGVAGLALLFLGARSHRKSFPVFAQGLIGAGVAILYLSVFASFNFYHIVSQLSAIMLMSVVTVIAFHQAFKYESQAVSLLGLAGGFLTPFLLSTGHPNETGLFFYIGLLEAGLLAVVLARREWKIIEILTLIGTYLTFTLWYSEYYNADALLPTVLFITLFWILFYLADLLRMYVHPRPDPAHQVINIVNAGIYYLYLYLIIDPKHHEIMGLLTGALACLYVVPALLTARRDPRSLMLRDYILTTAILLILATSVQFTGFITIALWSFEAAVFLWCARRWGHRYLAGAVLLFLIVIVVKLCSIQGTFGFVPIEEFTLVFNKRFLAVGALSASMGLSAYFFRDIVIGQRNVIRGFLHVTWCVLLFVLLTSETVDLFTATMRGVTGDSAVRMEFVKEMTLLCVWLLYSLPLVYFGVHGKSSPVLNSGLLLTGAIFLVMVVWGISFRPIEYFNPVVNVRAFTGLLILGGSALTARWLRGAREKIEIAGTVYPIVLIGQVLLVLMLLTGETRDIFEQKLFILNRTETPLASKLSSMESMKQLSLSGLWLMYGIGLMVGGILRRVRGLRITAMIILSAAILKIFIYDLSFLETFYRIFSFIGLGVILLSASYMYQKYKSLIFREGSERERQ